MTEFRTKQFIIELAKEGVRSRAGGPISINTLVGLENKLGLVVERRARDNSRIWTDEHKQRIKDYWLAKKKKNGGTENES